MTALVAAAAAPAAGAPAKTSAQPDRAPAQARITAEPRAGAAPVPLTPAQRGSLLKSAANSAAATAGALKLGAEEKLLPKDVIKDADGAVHTRYERTFAGLPVLGGDLVVHQRGTGRSVSKATEAVVSVPTTHATVPASTAQKSALAAARADGTGRLQADRTPRLVVWAAAGVPALAWESVVTGVEDDGSPREVHVVTDAKSGEKLREFETIHSGVGKGQFSGEVDLGSTRNADVFELTDAQRGGHRTYDLGNIWTGTATLFTDADDIWGDGSLADRQTAAVDAAYGAQQTWDFYRDRFGRNGIANDGVGASSWVHYGNGVVNAFWDNSCFCMQYGDGKNNQHPLTALDIAAHEMTHGVTAATANLRYLPGDTGGLNEGTSDIMAAAVEFFTDNPDDVPDYEVGERIDINGDGTPLRYMDRPSKDGISVDYWSADIEGLDPHRSSGVANHFFYLLAEGSGQKTVDGVGYDSPTYDGEPVPGLGLRNATNIWYRALTTYMTSTTDYAGARVATLQATADLFGRSSEEYETVGDTWAAVNVGARFVHHVALTTPPGQQSAVGQPATLKVTADTSRPDSLTYAATGLPDGLSIDHDTGVISGIPAETGEFTPTVTVSAGAGAETETGFAWSVIASGGDFFVNPRDIRIPDIGSSAESPLVVTGRTGNAPSALQVSVDIVHVYRGGLVIDLVGPGGTTYRLKNTASDSGNDVHATYTVDASAEPADGTWQLRVRDAYSGTTGYIDSWKLTF